LQRFVQGNKQTLTGTLRLGIYQPMSVFRTPQLIRAFHESHPDVIVDIQEGSQARLVELLNENKVDVVVSYTLIDFNQWETDTLASISPHAICSRQNALEAQRPVSVDGLQQECLDWLELS